jgi:glycosyltransferase involved in cell wall biosynthesis
VVQQPNKSTCMLDNKLLDSEKLSLINIDFTIITPSLNYHEYIREMLDSVVAQEGVTYEHLIYDAGSTDGTLEIIEEYKNAILTVEPDNGMSEAINKG